MTDDRLPSHQILGDHQRRGKRFIPPFLAQITNLKEVPWLKVIFPEILWLGLLNESLGLRAGADLAAVTASAVVECIGRDNKAWFARLSAFSTLNEAEQNLLREKLKSTGHLLALCDGLAPFFHFYPTFPLRFLYDGQAAEHTKTLADLVKYKSTVGRLRDKYDTPGTLMQANALYIGFVTRRIVVKKGLELANFPAVEHYPRTEKSKRVAAVMRAALTAFFGFGSEETSTDWQGDFWRRGFDLDVCEF